MLTSTLHHPPGLEVSTYPFREGYSENVIAELRGAEDPSKIIVVGGHYDSRSVNISVLPHLQAQLLTRCVSPALLTQDPDMRAPGADDNGSGTANVLELARIFTESGLKYVTKQIAKPCPCQAQSLTGLLRFKHTIRFCSWSGEEQGLVGSRAYAKEMREKNVDIIAVLNSDMLGTDPRVSSRLRVHRGLSFPSSL